MACIADGAAEGYIAGFLTGLARAARDPALERAAQGPHAALEPLLQDRLASLSTQPFTLN